MEHTAPTIRHRFSKDDRLLARAEFVHLATNAPRVSDRYFIAFFASAKKQNSRIGITVSRKVGDAVTRNRIKRLAREFFRHHRNMLTRPLDIHLIAKREAADSGGQTVFLSLEKIFRRIESFKK